MDRIGRVGEIKHLDQKVLTQIQKPFGVMGVENDSFLIPQRSDEASSTLPRREEEPQNSSYAAAG